VPANVKAVMEKAQSEESSKPGIASLSMLFTELESPLLRYAMKLVDNRGTAEDLLQDAFVRLHAHYTDVKNHRSWLYKTVNNLAMDHHRASRKVVSIETAQSGNEADVPDENLMPDEQLEKLETIGHMRLCMEELDAKGRELIRLKFEEDYSYRKISEDMGLTIGNVGYRLHHLIKLLDTCISKKRGWLA